MAMQELIADAKIMSIGGIDLMPRIILMTDGEPDNVQSTFDVASAIGMLVGPHFG